jgi:RES domain-containing protein
MSRPLPRSNGTGAMLFGARWNSPGRRVIYPAETYGGALLEILVHASGSVRQSQGYVEIEIPSGLSIEEITSKKSRRTMCRGETHHHSKPPEPSVIGGTTSVARWY